MKTKTETPITPNGEFILALDGIALRLEERAKAGNLLGLERNAIAALATSRALFAEADAAHAAKEQEKAKELESARALVAASEKAEKEVLEASAQSAKSADSGNSTLENRTS